MACAVTPLILVWVSSPQDLRHRRSQDTLHSTAWRGEDWAVLTGHACLPLWGARAPHLSGGPTPREGMPPVFLPAADPFPVFPNIL